MDIKTKFSKDDKVFFLTTHPDILLIGENAHNKPYVCEGIVDSIAIAYKHDKLIITYTVKVRSGAYNDGSINYKWVDVQEPWCAPDLVQLGVNVSERFKVNVLKPETKKRKKR